MGSIEGKAGHHGDVSRGLRSGSVDGLIDRPLLDSGPVLQLSVDYDFFINLED